MTEAMIRKPLLTFAGALVLFGAPFLLPHGTPLADERPRAHEEEHEEARKGGDEHAGHEGAERGEDEEGKIQLSPEARETAGIKVGRAELAPMGETLTVTGTVEASPEGLAVINSPLSGKVSRFLVNPGQAVKAGEPVIQIVSPEYSEAVAGLKARLAAYERAKRLFKEELISRAEMEEAEFEYRRDEAKVAQGRAKGTATKGNFLPPSGGGFSGESFLTLVSPIGGIVAERSATVGQVVEPATALLTIVNLDVVNVTANVPENEVGKVKVGQGVSVSVPSYPGRSFSGTVKSVSPKVDEKSRTLSVRCEAPNMDHLLKLEMFARVSLLLGEGAPVLSVPVTALAYEGSEAYVFVEEDGNFERRDVRVGRTSGNRAEILSGLKEGETIATEGVFVLKSEGNKDELKGDDD